MPTNIHWQAIKLIQPFHIGCNMAPAMWLQKGESTAYSTLSESLDYSAPLSKHLKSLSGGGMPQHNLVRVVYTSTSGIPTQAVRV